MLKINNGLENTMILLKTFFVSHPIINSKMRDPLFLNVPSQIIFGYLVSSISIMFVVPKLECKFFMLNVKAPMLKNP